MNIAYAQVGLGKYTAPGRWNDPDMLEVGNGGMKTDEYKVHMSLWAVLGAPLLAGNDLSKMSAADKAILTNREVIAIDQDALGKGGDRLRQIGDLSIWERPLSGGRTAVAIVNASWGGRDVPIDLATIGFPKGAKARDVWADKDLGRLHGMVNRHLPGHSVMLLILSE